MKQEAKQGGVEYVSIAKQQLTAMVLSAPRCLKKKFYFKQFWTSEYFTLIAYTAHEH